MDKGKTLLERLYRGEIFPAEEIVPNSDEYKATTREREILEDKLLKGMSERQAELLEDYEAAIENTHRLNLQDTYAEGIRFGARFMLETLFVDGTLPPLRKKQ